MPTACCLREGDMSGAIKLALQERELEPRYATSAYTDVDNCRKMGATEPEPAYESIGPSSSPI